MNKKFILLILFSMIMITACTNTEEVVSQLKDDKEKLTLSLNEKEKTQKKEKELFTTLSNLSIDFVEGQSTGNKEKLKSLMSEDIFIEERDDKLYITSNVNDQYQIYTNDNKKLNDWEFQGFQYDSEHDTYLVQIKEIYKDVKWHNESAPIFFNLTFKLLNNEWKIVGLSSGLEAAIKVDNAGTDTTINYTFKNISKEKVYITGGTKYILFKDKKVIDKGSVAITDYIDLQPGEEFEDKKVFTNLQPGSYTIKVEWNKTVITDDFIR